MTSFEVIEALKKRGLTEEQAAKAYAQIEEEYNGDMRSKGLRKLLIGLVILIIGVVVTAASVGSKGGVIAYGAIIYGLINTVMGAKMRSDYA